MTKRKTVKPKPQWALVTLDDHPTAKDLEDDRYWKPVWRCENCGIVVAIIEPGKAKLPASWRCPYCCAEMTQ